MSCRNLTHSLTVSISLKAILRKNLALIFENVCFERWGLALIYSSQTPWHGVNIAQKNRKGWKYPSLLLLHQPHYIPTSMRLRLKVVFWRKDSLPFLMFMTSERRAEMPSVPDSLMESPTTRSSSSRKSCKRKELGWYEEAMIREGGCGEGESVCQLLAVSV